MPALTLALIILLALWAVLNALTEYAMGDRKASRLMRQAFRVIRETYVRQVPATPLTRGAIHGMVASLGDRYCAYLPPVQNKLVQQAERGEIGGVGIELSFKNREVVVIAPVEGMPAQKAGIMPGDVIVEVDGHSCQGRSLGEVASMIRGVIGAELTLAVRRKGVAKPLQFKLKRAKIRVSNVHAAMLPNHIALVRIALFSEGVHKDFRRALKKLIKQGMKGLILDLRFNPGGIVDEAANVADALLREGVIVRTRSRHRYEEFVHKAKKATTLTDAPCVVLVNQGTASSSEILAGALQDHKRAVLIGVKTFGKGVVTKTIPLADGSSLVLTVAKYYTPNGRCIEGVGLTPDIEERAARIPAPRKSDAALRRAEEFLRKRL